MFLHRFQLVIVLMAGRRRVRRDVVGFDLGRTMIGATMMTRFLQESQSTGQRRFGRVEVLVMRRGDLRGRHRRSRMMRVERATTNTKASSLKDLPIDDTHADQGDVESTDCGDDRVRNIADQMTLIGRTTAWIAKDRKEMRTGDNDRGDPNHTDQNQDAARSAFRRVIH